MRLSRIGMTAAGLLALVLGTASPASAMPTDGTTTLLRATSYDACLDGNSAGSVYVSACDRNNAYQQWTFSTQSNGFQIRSQGTQRCLADDGNRIVTRTCDANDIHQTWFANANSDPRFSSFNLLNNGTSRYLAYDSTIGLTGTPELQSTWNTR